LPVVVAERAPVPPDQLALRELLATAPEFVAAPRGGVEQTVEVEAVECLVPDRVEVDF
jgi:hypothetical protein